MKRKEIDLPLFKEALSKGSFVNPDLGVKEWKLCSQSFHSLINPFLFPRYFGGKGGGGQWSVAYWLECSPSTSQVAGSNLGQGGFMLESW